MSVNVTLIGDLDALPSTGTMLSTLSQAAIDADAYDREQPEKVKATLY